MFPIKEILVLTACLILAAIGFTEISKSEKDISSNTQLQDQSKTNFTEVSLSQSSDEFLLLP